MKTNPPCSCVWLAGIVAMLGISEVRSETAHVALLECAEARFRAICTRDEFRPKRFQAEWLPDSSGCTVLARTFRTPHETATDCRRRREEAILCAPWPATPPDVGACSGYEASRPECAPDAIEGMQARSDLASGRRTVLDSAPGEKSGQSRQLSPDGGSDGVAGRGNLLVWEGRSDADEFAKSTTWSYNRRNRIAVMTQARQIACAATMARAPLLGMARREAHAARATEEPPLPDFTQSWPRAINPSSTGCSAARRICRGPERRRHLGGTSSPGRMAE